MRFEGSDIEGFGSSYLYVLCWWFMIIRYSNSLWLGLCVIDGFLLQWFDLNLAHFTYLIKLTLHGQLNSTNKHWSSMTASMLGTLPHIEPSNDLHLPLRQDWHTLATRLKEMYAHSSENKNPFAECAGLTMAIASLNASTKKRKIDLRDVIINNLILSWNIRNVILLTCSILCCCSSSN